MSKTTAFSDLASLSLRVVLVCAALSGARGVEPQQMVRFTDSVALLGGKNLVPNGSFELGSVGWSSLGLGAGHGNLWAPLVGDWGNFDRLQGEIVKSGASDARSFLRIRLGGKHTPVFNFDYFEPVNRRELRPLAANVGWIEVTPGEPYTLSLDMRASRDGVRAAFGIQNEDASAGADVDRSPTLHNVTLARNWKRYSHTFTAKHPFLFVLAGPDLAREEKVAVDVDAIQLEKGTRATPFETRSGLEIGVTPASPAGVFTVGKSAKLKIAAANSSAAPTRAHIKFKVTDYDDQPVELSDIAFDVPANTSIERQFTLPSDWRGFYRVVASWAINGKEESRLLRVAIVPARTTRETVIGVNHAYPTSSLLDLAEKAGVTWHRDWSLKWQHIEPEKGNYRWSISDPQIKRVPKRGRNLMAMFPFPSTDWNSSAPDVKVLMAESPRYGKGGLGDDAELLFRARWAWAPQDTNDLGDIIRTIVSRYKQQVKVWEFLNEPLCTAYSLPSDGVLKSKNLKGYSDQDYFKLLRVAAAAIRSANPCARIIGGPGTHAESSYTVSMVKAGLLDLVDILGVHDYPSLDKPETRIAGLDKLLAEMKTHGGPKPMWMTEFSYFGSDDLPREPFIPIPGLWSERRLLSEKQTADYIIRYCTIFLSRGGEKIFLHSGCTGSVNHPGTESCLFAQGAVRKVFPAMAVFTEMMGASPKFVADRIRDGAYAFAFETGRRAIVVLWNPDGKTSVRIPPGATCNNLMGRAVTGPTVKLAESPVYLISKPNRARELLTSLD